MRFLLRWQHLDPATAAVGEGGLLDVIEQLQGFDIAAGVLEAEVLSPRIGDYNAGLLDRLCEGGGRGVGLHEPATRCHQRTGRQVAADPCHTHYAVSSGVSGLAAWTGSNRGPAREWRNGRGAVRCYPSGALASSPISSPSPGGCHPTLKKPCGYWRLRAGLPPIACNLCGVG